MLFELANPVGGVERRYNWEQKVMIGLQANELAAILSDPDGNHEFFHDTCEHKLTLNSFGGSLAQCSPHAQFSTGSVFGVHGSRCYGWTFPGVLYVCAFFRLPCKLVGQQQTIHTLKAIAMHACHEHALQDGSLLF
jgi:hypothetical protein